MSMTPQLQKRISISTSTSKKIKLSHWELKWLPFLFLLARNMVFLRSWDKWLRCLFNISSRPQLPVRVLLAQVPYTKPSSSGSWFVLPYVIQRLVLIFFFFFCKVTFLPAALGSPLFPLPSTSSSHRAMNTLDLHQMCLPLAILFLLSTVNFHLHHT